MKAGDKLRVKVGQGDTATQSGNRLEDGDIVMVRQDFNGDTNATVAFTRADGTYGTAFPYRFEAVPEATPEARRISASTQLGKVLNLTLGGGAWTLAGIASVTGASEAAVSARLRDLRAAGYEVTCVKHRGDAQRSYTVRTKVISVDTAGTATVG